MCSGDVINILYELVCKPFPIFSSHQLLAVIVVVSLLCLQTIGSHNISCVTEVDVMNIINVHQQVV